MTVGHVMSDPRTTQIEYMFSSLVSVFSHIVYVWLDRLLAVRSTLLADINKKKRSYYLFITKYLTLSALTITITTRCCHAHMSLLTWERCTCSRLSSTIFGLIR